MRNQWGLLYSSWAIEGLEEEILKLEVKEGTLRWLDGGSEFAQLIQLVLSSPEPSKIDPHSFIFNSLNFNCHCPPCLSLGTHFLLPSQVQ